MSELHIIYRPQKHKDRNGEKIVFEMKYFAFSVMGFFCLASVVVVMYLFTVFSSPTLVLPSMHCVEKYIITYSSVKEERDTVEYERKTGRSGLCR
jgi:hypothetical protein